MRNRKVELGTVLLIVASGLVTLLGATALAVDVGYFFLVKNQLQNAADAAVLAGAQGLITDPGNYADDGAAKTLAIQYAGLNEAEAQPVVLSPGEITFCSDEQLDDCQANPSNIRSVIRVAMTRNVQTMFGAVFGVPQVAVGVTAAAGVSCTNGGTGAPSGGWRPFAIPDQFANRDSGTRVLTRGFGQPFDSRRLGPCDPTCIEDPSCTMNPVQDWYMSPFDDDVWGLNLSLEWDFGNVTGYIAMRDVIDLYYFPVTLKVGSPSGSIAPGQFYPITYPPNARSGGGGSEYRNNIAYGYDGYLQIGDLLYVEPGNMIGPTRQGINDLIAQDPNAYLVLDNGAVRIEGSLYPEGKSPRLIPVPMFDPSLPPDPGRDFLEVTNIGGFFVRQQCGDDVMGTFLPIQIIGGTPGGDLGIGCLAATVRLIE
jgi:Flp pilus assembly protein TadG